MRMLALAAVVIVGCATRTTLSPGSNHDHLEHESRKIDRSEQACIHNASTWSNQQIARITDAPGPSRDRQMRKLADERARMVSQCQAIANRKREALSSDERAAYRRRAQEERNRASLMTILTTSGPR